MTTLNGTHSPPLTFRCDLSSAIDLQVVFWDHGYKNGDFLKKKSNTHLALSLIMLAVHLTGVTHRAGLYIYVAFYLPLYQQREETEASLN